MNYKVLLISPDFLLSAAEGFNLQRSEEGLGLNCQFVAKGDNGSKNIRGAVYGPIMYANAKLIYFIGREELFGSMPACRNTCNSQDCDPFMDM